MKAAAKLEGAALTMCVVVSVMTGATAYSAESQAKTKPPAPELDFLEYLGTLESDEENWTDVVNVQLPAPKEKEASSKSKPEAAKPAGNAK